MKRLLLLRHAKAAAPEEALADIGRPLAERGERDARRMGERLRQHQARPDLILASPAVRTQRTAELVAAAFAYPSQRIALDARLYLADPEEMIALLALQDSAVEVLLVVGHNPGITDLARELLPHSRIGELPTGGLVALDTPGSDWASLRDGPNHFASYDFPKNPGAPVTAD